MNNVYKSKKKKGELDDSTMARQVEINQKRSDELESKKRKLIKETMDDNSDAESSMPRFSNAAKRREKAIISIGKQKKSLREANKVLNETRKATKRK